VSVDRELLRLLGLRTASYLFLVKDSILSVLIQAVPIHIAQAKGQDQALNPDCAYATVAEIELMRPKTNRPLSRLIDFICCLLYRVDNKWLSLPNLDQKAGHSTLLVLKNDALRSLD
jgi:hypothetical protein